MRRLARLRENTPRVMRGLIFELWVTDVVRFEDVGCQLLDRLKDVGRQKFRTVEPPAQDARRTERKVPLESIRRPAG